MSCGKLCEKGGRKVDVSWCRSRTVLDVSCGKCLGVVEGEK